MDANANNIMTELIKTVANDPAMGQYAWDAFSLLLEVDQGPPASMEIKGYLYGAEDAWGPLPIDYASIQQLSGALYGATRGPEGQAWKKCLVQFHKPGKVKMLFEHDDDSRWTITPDDPNALPNEVRLRLPPT